MFDGLLKQVEDGIGGANPQQSGIATSLLNQLSSGGGAGLAGLVQQLTSGGLGQQVASWVGTGSNQPVSPQQVEQAMGPDRIKQLAAEHGIDTQQLTSHLAQILPVVIDKLTPNGQVPQGGSIVDELKGMFGAAQAKP